MRRQDRFVPSAALYAVDLSGLTREHIVEVPFLPIPLEMSELKAPGTAIYRYEIPCVWFRRRRGLDTANIGYLWDISTDHHIMQSEAEARRFLEDTLVDGRQGPHCRTRWDGERLWSDPSTARVLQIADATFLQSMLDAYPSIPAGFDGWWRFLRSH